MSMDTWLSALVGKSRAFSKAMLGGTSRLDSLVIEQSRNNSQTCYCFPQLPFSTLHPVLGLHLILPERG